jgi:hypothetical protein
MPSPIDSNPLLDFSGLPRFAEFKPEFVTPAIDRLLADARAAVARAEAADTPAEWDAFVAPLDDANEKLGRAWGQVSHLHSVMDSPALREVYNENLPKITVFYAELGQNEALFAKYKALKASPGYATLAARARSRRQRSARFPSVRRRIAGRPETALPGHHGRVVATGGQVLRERPRRDQRLCRNRHRRSATRRPARRRQGCRPRGGRGRRLEGWKFTLQRRPTVH